MASGYCLRCSTGFTSLQELIEHVALVHECNPWDEPGYYEYSREEE